MLAALSWFPGPEGRFALVPMKLPLAARPILEAAAASKALLKAKIWGATVAMVPPQKFGVTWFGPVTVAAPPATELPTAPGLVGQLNGLAPSEHTSGV